VTVPFLSTANWEGKACTRAATSRLRACRIQEKWLEAHGIEHWTHFYTDYGVALQKRSSRTISRARATGGAISRRPAAGAPR